ncbi:hypothetical protein S7335_2463 [Synechococcus sp. PCC 7335]|nr:hypothetical protein S7335_2463 [Synechococcus sp. PCC 7335]
MFEVDLFSSLFRISLTYWFLEKFEKVDDKKTVLYIKIIKVTGFGN